MNALERQHRILASACGKLSLTFSSRMIKEWEGDFINANTGYNPNLDDKTYAWTREAASSTGITALERAAIDMDLLPASLQVHLTEVAIPTYEFMMSSNSQEQKNSW